MKLSQDQKIIYDFLGNIHPKASQAYLGALEVLEQDHKDRIHQSANSIRHALGLITRDAELEKGAENKDDSQKKKLKKIVDPFGRSTSELDFLINLLIDEYYEWFTGVAHYGKFPPNGEYRRKFVEMEGILLKIAMPHFDVIGEIDKILANEKPSISVLKKLSGFIVRQSSYDYFFQNASSDWLPFLIKKGYFDNPKHLIKEGSRIMYNFVEPSRYLARSAEKRSNEVLKVILNHSVPMKEERNPIILESFVIAATNMSSKQATKIVNRICDERWLDVLYFSRLNELVADLMVKLSNNKYNEDAIKLAQSLFDVTQGEPRPSVNTLEEYVMIKDVRPIIDNYLYTHIAKEKLPILAKNDPESLVSLLVILLNKSIFLENAGYNQRKSKSDSSYHWKSSIDSREQSSDRDFRSVLVDILSDVLESEGSQNISRLKKEMSIIKQKQYPLFRRLELHIYRKYPKYFKHAIEEAVIQHFGKWEMQHEYYYLLKNAFPILSKNAKNAFLNKVKIGPSKELVKKWEENEKRYPGETVESRRKYWIVDKLYPVKDFLNDGMKEDYDNMVTEVGAPDIPNFDYYHPTMESAKPVTNLGDGLSVDDVINFVKTHKMKQDSEFPFFDGTKGKFQEYVENNPIEYSKKAMDLKSSDPELMYALFLGLENAIRKNIGFDWKEVLSLCNTTMESIRNNTHPKTHELDILRSMASLLDAGLKQENVQPVFTHRDEIWKILHSLVEMGGSEDSWEENYPDKNWDSIGISINTTTGETFHALLHYALWCNSHLKEKNTGPYFAPEVRALLDDYLEQKITNTISRHTVLGFQFPNLLYLNHDWTLTNLEKIFSKDNPKLKRAAWDAYLHNNVYIGVFKNLYRQYFEHIQTLHKPDLIDGRLTKFDENLINHITIAYLYGVENGETLFYELLKVEDEKVLSHWAWEIGRVLRSNEENPNKSFDLEAVRKIWKSKLVNCGEINWWFIHSPFDKEETIDLLLESLKRTPVLGNFVSTVEKKLEEYAKEIPLKTIEVLELIMKSDKNKSELYAIRGITTKNLLKTLLETKNKKAIIKTKSLINYLGTLGFNEYRDLLKNDKE